MIQVKNSLSKTIAAAFVLLGLNSGEALGFGDQWYIGIAGGASWLQPNPEEPGLDPSVRAGEVGSFILGRDIDDRSSAQLQFYSLGESELENGEIVDFFAADASILYRLYDSRDRSLTRSSRALTFYGRFALGFLERDTEVPLSDDAGVYFGAGAGVEFFFNDHISVRAEGLYHERDASSGTLALVARFGGVRGRNAQRPITPPPVPSTASAPSQDAGTLPTVPAVPGVTDTPVTVTPPTSNLPETISVPAPNSTAQVLPSAADADGDGVADAADQCANSRAGYPVRETGCALFDGVLSGVTFLPNTSTLVASAYSQLDDLANVLSQYPNARVELLAHTDNKGSVREQAIITRARLRSVGTYLVQRGIKANRLVLRSFGGTRPLYDNSSQAGQDANNRIELIEYRGQ